MLYVYLIYLLCFMFHTNTNTYRRRPSMNGNNILAVSYIPRNLLPALCIPLVPCDKCARRKETLLKHNRKTNK